MVAFFDDQTIPISCPKCGKEAEKTIRWLNSNSHYTCPGCHSTINLDSDQFRDEIRKAEKAIKDFKKGLGKL